MQLNEWLETELQQDIWKKKYQFEDENLEEFFNRVSGGNENIKQLMKEKKVLPAGRILANKGLQGKGRKVSYSNCYFIPAPSDNIESIFDTAKYIARTFSYGGGCGTDISKLSPKGSKINNASRETTGSVSFMEIYDLTTDKISMTGRRGALILTIKCDHPDLEEFIDIKNDLSKINKANISIKVTDDFMKAVEDDKDWQLYFYRPETNEKIIKNVRARDIFKKISKSNWRQAEPGILFWDNINNWNLMSEDERFQYGGVNPCGEETLPDYGACLLSAINLSEFVVNDKFDFANFDQSVRTVTTYMNKLLDESLNLHPLEQQREVAKNWRLSGTGVMSYADMLIKLGIKYGSQEALDLTEQIGKTMINSALQQSALLAKEYGAFPMCDKNKILMSPFFQINANNKTKELVGKYGLRNSQLLTCAPTGSISTMLGVSGGIEPIFQISYKRKTESLHNEDRYYKVYTPIVKEYMEKHNIKNEKDLPDYFVTAHDLDYKERIKTQGIWQRYIDASISSTVNLPNTTTPKDIENLYMIAWKEGLKGITIYRDGCEREGVLLKEDTQNQQSEPELKRGDIIKAPEVSYNSKTVKLYTGCGSAWLTMTKDNQRYINQIFIKKGSKGTCHSTLDALTRTVSQSLRGGINLEDVIDQLLSAPVCASYYGTRKSGNIVSKGNNCASAIAYELRLYQEEEHKNQIEETSLKEKIDKEEIMEEESNNCPDCGSKLILQEGCQQCVCGYSKCG